MRRNRTSPAGRSRVARGCRGRSSASRRAGGPDLQPVVRERRVDDTRQRHGRWSLEREPDVQRLAELRSGPGRRGADDRLRGREPRGAVGDVVREHAGHRVRAEQHLREPVRQRQRQVDLRRSGSRHRRRRQRAGPVAEHPDRSVGREPVGRGRLGGGRDQARPVGDLAGDDERSGQRRGSDLRQPARSARDRPTATASPRPARRRHRTRPGDRRLLLPADRRPAAWARQHRPEPEHRPDAQRRRAGHRVHRQERRNGVQDGVPWVVWYEKDNTQHRRSAA